eukprot:SAG31_NODE_2197_length_6216_cov_4.189962_5_plen_126_part_00
MDHYLLDAAGMLGKPHAFTGACIVDGDTFEVYFQFIESLIKGHSSPAACVTACEQYHEFRVALGMDGSDGVTPARLEAASHALGVELPALQVRPTRPMALIVRLVHRSASSIPMAMLCCSLSSAA